MLLWGGCLALQGVPAERLASPPRGHVVWDTEVTQCLDVRTLFQAEDLLRRSPQRRVLDSPVVQLSD